MTKTYYWMLRNDDHNTPTRYKFRDEEQAIAFLRARGAGDDDLGLDEEAEPGQQLMDSHDGNGDLWESFGESPDPPELYVADLTGAK